MNITTSQLENVKELKTITAVSTFGTGFLTSFVSYFIELFGIENNMLAEKIVKAKESAIQKLVLKANSIKADGIMNLRFEFSKMTVMAYGTAYGLCDVSASNETTSYNDIPEI